MSDAERQEATGVQLFFEAMELDDGFETPEGLVRYHDRGAQRVLGLDTREQDRQLGEFGKASDSDGDLPRIVIESGDPDALQSALRLFQHLSGVIWFGSATLHGLVRLAAQLTDLPAVARLARVAALYGGRSSAKWAIVYSAVVQVAQDRAAAGDDKRTNIEVPVLEFVPSLSEDRWTGAIRSIEPLLRDLDLVAGDPTADGSALSDDCENHARIGRALVYESAGQQATAPPQPETVYGWIRSTVRLLEAAHGLNDQAQQLTQPILDQAGPDGVRRALQFAGDAAQHEPPAATRPDDGGQESERLEEEAAPRGGRLVRVLGAILARTSDVITVGQWVAQHTPPWVVHAIEVLVQLVQSIPHP